MTKPTTQELKTQLEQLVEAHNKALETMQNCRQAIIATQAVIKDRESEDGNTETDTSSTSEN